MTVKYNKSNNAKLVKDDTGKRNRTKGNQSKILLNAMRNSAEQTSGSNDQLASRMQAQVQQKAAQPRPQKLISPITQMQYITHLTNCKKSTIIDRPFGFNLPLEHIQP